MDAVALHELARLRQALVRLVGSRALEQELDAPPARPIAGLIPVEEISVAHVDAELGKRPAVRVDDADPHRLSLLAVKGGGHE